jgi:transposase InsO family protein
MFEANERLACAVLEVGRTSIRSHSHPSDDAVLRARLRELATERRRFGYRRLHILIRREGVAMNHKKFVASIVRNGCRSAGAAGAKERSAPGRRWQSSRGRTSAGAWTSCRIPLSTVAAFASFRSSTISPANTWRTRTRRQDTSDVAHRANHGKELE